MTKTILTKGDIKRLGDTIRLEKGHLNEATLSNLQIYRTSYKDSLSKVFNILCNHCKQIRKDSIVTYRIKRFESIINKLHRFPGMQFDRMWDIAGCRCILNSNQDAYKLKDKIKSDLTIRKVNDYIKEPQKEGYRSLHVFVMIPGDDKVIEVQIRNQRDHNWATLVEITDLLYDEKLKECDSNPELTRFHFLLSKRDILTLNEKKELFQIEMKYRYLDKLSSVFSKNYLSVRKQWLTIEKNFHYSYYIIETQKEDTPKINSFQHYQTAENEYFNRFKNNRNSNVILTHIHKATYDQISVAYSNYILTVHQFLDDCYNILESLLIESLKDKQIFTFAKFYGLYLHTLVTNINNIRSEITEAENFGNKTKGNSKVREWIVDIKRQIFKRNEHARKLRISFSRSAPRSIIYISLINFIVKYLTQKYNRKLK